MQHQSWLFPGACTIHRQPNEVTSQDSSSNGSSNNNKNITDFEINAFVRSLNRNGIQLPEGFIFQCSSVVDPNNNNNNNNNNNQSTKTNICGNANVNKSLNDFLTILNDSVDHVIDGCNANDRSDLSFASFRSSNEDKDSARWNDLIHLVSTTAHEFRVINNVGNDKKIHTISSKHQKTPQDLLVNQSLIFKCTDWRDNRNEYGRLKLLVNRKISKTDLDVTATNDESCKPEIVKIYTDNRNTNEKRFELNEESLKKIQRLETSKSLVNEIFRATTNLKDRNSSNWITWKREINVEDESWPSGFGLTCNNDFLPYFTGGTLKTFGFRGSNIVRDSWIDPKRRFMNVSRSLPIFVDGGESAADTLVALTRDDITHENKSLVSTVEIINGENFLDAQLIKFGNTITDPADSSARDLKLVQHSVNRSKISGDVGETQKKSLIDSRMNEDGGRKEHRRTKLVVKRERKVRKQISKKVDHKGLLIDIEDEKTSIQKVNSIAKSSPNFHRHKAVQSFQEDSYEIRKDNEKITGTEKNQNSIETGTGIASKINPLSHRLNQPQQTVLTENRNRNKCCALKRTKGYSKIVEERSRKCINQVTLRRTSLASTDRNTIDSKRLYENNCGTERGNCCSKPICKPGGRFKNPSLTNATEASEQSTTAQLMILRTPQKNVMNASRFPRNNAPTMCSERLENPLQHRTNKVQTERIQRPVTAKEILKTRIPSYCRVNVESQRRTLESLNNRDLSKEEKKSLLNNETKRVSDSNATMTIPVLRSKTFVHQITREPSVRRVLSKSDYSKSIKGRSSTRFTENSSSSCPLKQLFRKSWKKLSYAQKEVDLSSDTNFDDTTLDSQINTDTELCRSVSAESNFNARNITFNVENCSNDSILVKKVIVTEANDNKETSLRSQFQKKHQKSLRILKSILSHHGVNVENVKKEATEIRSRILKDTTKLIGQKKSSVISETSKNLRRTSRTLFEKLAILVESKLEQLDRTDFEVIDSSEPFSSYTNLWSGSVTSYAKLMEDAGDQCSIEDDSSMISRISVYSDKSSYSKNLHENKKRLSDVYTETNEHYGQIWVDSTTSPLPSIANFERTASIKCFKVVEAQTQTNIVDKYSIIDETCRRVVNVFTETEIINSATKEVFTDCCKRECEISEDNTPRKVFSDIISISRKMNTDNTNVYVKSRGVCFRGPRKISVSSQVKPFENTKDAATGKDYVELQSVSEQVNTDRQDYLYVDRSVDLLGPGTLDDACQIEPLSRIIDVAVGECSSDTKLSSNFRTIDIVKDLHVPKYKSSPNFNASRHNYRSPCSSSSSLIICHPIDRMPRKAIIALELAIERGRNLYKAIEIYRENLASGKSTEEDESMNCKLSKNNVKKYEKSDKLLTAHIAFCDNSMIKPLLETNLKESLRCSDIIDESSSVLRLNDTRFSNCQDEITIVMDSLLTNVIRKVKNKLDYDQLQDNSGNVIEESPSRPKKRERPCPEVRTIFEDINYTRDENFVQIHEKSLQFSFLSRNSLLTVVYSTVCSLVFWALQFSITCDTTL